MAISVNMLRLRVTIDRQPRSKKGHAPHRTTGAARMNSIHCTVLGESTCMRGMPGSMSAIPRISTGSVSAAQTQKRRDISASSGLGGSAEVTVRGSSAIPQIGQAPGPGRTISGCIGQVYSADAEEIGAELMVIGGAEPSYLAGL